MEFIEIAVGLLSTAFLTIFNHQRSKEKETEERLRALEISIARLESRVEHAQLQ
tara:strand:+ start:38 stop:199 length:162 start_codon:yes stop_codon:yes gene_type:complete